MQLMVEEDPNMTFAPAINDRSVRLAMSRNLKSLQEDLPVPDRLTTRQAPKLTQGLILTIECKEQQ